MTAMISSVRGGPGKYRHPLEAVMTSSGHLERDLPIPYYR
jgi:hypothetical protein